jgi:serine/threonine protein kinase/Tol biopolymer transport system component
MPEIGQTLSHYKILEKIGEGGMGEVYLAEDLTLDRKVALKFLPEAFTSDPERMARFEREAKLLASLNHPNIAGIYGLEQADKTRFLVLEYVEGETLQARLSKGALPLEEALALCRQIAEGLEAAHEKGVIHRDLKPANVMITGEEKVKILDFGLAKAFSDDTQSIDSSQSPTLTEAMTRPGVILGTVAYMSPEQAKGKSVDKSADIWAFGCILYECLTGKKVFEGETVTETLASVIKEEPNWEALPSNMPQNIRFVLRRCLEKEKGKRFRDAADVQIEMEETRITDVDKTTIPIKRSKLAWIWALIATVLVIVLSFLYFRSDEVAKAQLFHLSVPPMPIDRSMAISPDGKWIAFVAEHTESATSLYVCKIGEVQPTHLKGTEGATCPFWSPNSRSIGFFAEGKLKRVDLSGGPPRIICDARSTSGGTWNSDGTIIFTNWPHLHRVSADTGGDSVVINSPDTSQGGGGLANPCFLPDGRHYLYTAQFSDKSKSGIYLASIDSEKKTRLLTTTSSAAYVEPGYLLYHRKGTLFARPFDTKKLKLAGEELIVAENVILDENSEWGAFSASQNGTLIYRSLKNQFQSQFVWIDRDGNQLEPIGIPEKYSADFDLSPDGKQIAVVRENLTTFNVDIYLLDLKTNILTQFTSDPKIDGGPRWSPDGSQLLFVSWRSGICSLFLKDVDGVSEVKPLLDPPIHADDPTWSGQYILFSHYDDIYAIAHGEQEPIPIVQSISSKSIGSPNLSIDGNWLAYQSDRSGVYEIYVRSFPVANQEKQVSINGGMHPRWKDDGKELYYLSLDGKLMAVSISTGKKIDSGKPHVLFDANLSVNENSHGYLPNADGSRFLLLKPVAEAASTPITIVFNWTELLEK